MPYAQNSQSPRLDQERLPGTNTNSSDRFLSKFPIGVMFIFITFLLSYDKIVNAASSLDHNVPRDGQDSPNSLIKKPDNVNFTAIEPSVEGSIPANFSSLITRKPNIISFVDPNFFVGRRNLTSQEISSVYELVVERMIDRLAKHGDFFQKTMINLLLDSNEVIFRLLITNGNPSIVFKEELKSNSVRGFYGSVSQEKRCGLVCVNVLVDNYQVAREHKDKSCRYKHLEEVLWHEITHAFNSLINSQHWRRTRLGSSVCYGREECERVKKDMNLCIDGIQHSNINHTYENYGKCFSHRAVNRASFNHKCNGGSVRQAVASHCGSGYMPKKGEDYTAGRLSDGTDCMVRFENPSYKFVKQCTTTEITSPYSRGNLKELYAHLLKVFSGDIELIKSCNSFKSYVGEQAQDLTLRLKRLADRKDEQAR